MDILITRTQFICLSMPGHGLNPGISVLKLSALPIDLTWQTNHVLLLMTFEKEDLDILDKIRVVLYALYLI